MANSNEYMREYMLRRYHQRRAEAFELLGGKCAECGSTELLELDHVDPSTKTIKLNKMWSCTKEKFLSEIKLCQLLCKKHHIEKTRQEQSVEHGGGTTGKRNCRCELCGPLKRAYYRARKGR